MNATRFALGMWLGCVVCFVASAASTSPGATPLTRTELATTTGGVTCEETAEGTQICDECHWIGPLWTAMCYEDTLQSIVCEESEEELGYECETDDYHCEGLRDVFNGPNCVQYQATNACNHTIPEANLRSSELLQCD